MRNRIKIILPIALISVLLIVISFFLNIENDAVSSVVYSNIWLFVTNIGGTIGSIILILTLSFLVALKNKHSKNKITKFITLVCIFVVIIASVAKVNEYLIKEYVKHPRPDIVLLAKSNNFTPQDMYSLDSKEKRSEYLKTHVKENEQGGIIVNGMKVQPNVWHHWLNETGYSFPSGHSVNIFLIVFLITYILLLKFKSFGRYGVLIFYLTAISVVYSRLLLGVHSSLDVSFGALWGTLIGFIIVSTGLFDFIDRKLLSK